MKHLSHRLPAAFRERDFALLWVSLLATGGATQMVQVAVGWQVYSLHHRAFDLALIGLAEFVPLPLLALPFGQLADRLPRARLLALSSLLEAGLFGLLLAITLGGTHALWPYLVVAAGTGVASALGAPAGRSMVPELVPEEVLQSAMALRSMAFQAAMVGGPAVGGLVFAVDPVAVYAVAAGLGLAGFGAMLAVRSPAAVPAELGAPRLPGLQGLLDGLRFVRDTPVLLGAITLDLFAVLFGGAVALLPLFAQSILHTGPIGLGILRSAPAVGALAAGAWLVRRPLDRHAGRTLLQVVGAFGVSIVVFGFSRWFLLSLAALAVSGFVDMISMNIRATTVALATPNVVRGRVMAVEMVFISASNELGAFESGAAAALLGAVPAVVAGGAITILLALTWSRVFPPLARVDRLEDLRAAAVPAD